MDNAISENKKTTAGYDACIRERDLVLLWFEKVTYLVEVVADREHPIHCGKPLQMNDWIGKPWGSKVIAQHAEGFLLRPTVTDLMMKASRESGIIYPKDAAYLMMKAGIKSGAKVLEIGTGSGSLTTAMATMVAPSGVVWTYDRRMDLPRNAHKNITRAGLGEYVVFSQRTAGEEFKESGFDVVTLDIPTPWEEVDVVKKALKNGGRLVSLNPTFNQIEKMAEALKEAGFILIESVELLERPILARGGKTRPVQRMVSHTEFMLFAVKAGDD